MSDTRSPLTPRTLAVGASATVVQIAALRSEILAVLDVSDEVVLDLGALVDADFTFFQALCAAQREAQLRNKRLSVVGQSADIDATARAAGFLHSGDSLPDCQWTEADHG